MTIESFLNRLPSATLDRLENPGNCGDGLIDRGLDTLLEKCGIAYKTFSAPEVGSADTLLIIGAGTFSHAWSYGVDRVRFYAEKYQTVCITPASFDASYSPVKKLLQELPGNVIIFCRENVSFKALNALVPKRENIHLDHDLAFHNDVSPWMMEGHGEINCFRTDKEAIGRLLPEKNFDLSGMGRQTQKTLLLDILKNFKTVNTDRLHVAIAAAMLEKNVRMFANSYHKLSSVYDYSLKKYPNVSICSEETYRKLLNTQFAGNKYERYLVMLQRIPGALKLVRGIKRSLG